MNRRIAGLLCTLLLIQLGGPTLAAVEEAACPRTRAVAGVLDSGNLRLEWALFSRDDRHLAYMGFATAPARERVAVFCGKRPRALTPPEWQVSGFGWLPDGESVVVARRVHRRTELVEVDLSGRVERRIRLQRARFEITGPIAARADAEEVIVSASPDPTSGSHLFTVDLTDGGIEQLTTTSATESHTAPALVDDASLIYEAHDSHSAGPTGVYLLSLETMQSTRYSLPDHHVFWSGAAPITEQAAFAALEVHDPEDNEQLWIGTLTEPPEVARNHTATPRAISADATRVLMSVRGNAQQFRLVPIARLPNETRSH